MTRAQLKEHADASLEIISIGSLYTGSWDKKYWSSSRGKDRYPYPVGYQAVRAYNGIKYKMEVLEGPKGPLFMILSMDGTSFSGQTPDIAWEMFQRKGCLHTKIWHGKRSSCKVDGAEFFGFKNPFIQRLLRELVANVSGTAELGVLPSNICNKASGSAQTAVEHHTIHECENVALVACHEKPKTARKRRSCHGTEMEKSLNGTNLKKVRNHGLRIRSTTTKHLSSAFANEVNQGFCEKAMCVQEKVAVSESTQAAHNVSIDEKHHDRLSMEKLEGISLEMETDGNSADGSIQMLYCPDTEDSNHHASHTSVTVESAPVSTEKKILNQHEFIIPEELVMDSHSEEIFSLDTNLGSNKNDFDSVGQDMVKSMMTFLLPQAIPLLKENSGRKEMATSNMERFICDGNTKNVLPIEIDGEKQEYMHIQCGSYEFAVPSLKFSKHGLDNHEGEHHDDHANINCNFSSIADNGQGKEDMQPIDSCERMNDELVNDHEATGNKKSSDSESGGNLRGTCQDDNLYVSECPPSTSSGRVLSDETMHNNKKTDGCPLYLEKKTPKVHVESHVDEQPCSSGSSSQLLHAKNANDSSVKTSTCSEALNKEDTVGQEAAGMDTLPSSQTPNIVYRRRKAQNVSHLGKEYKRQSNEGYDTSCLGKYFGAETSSLKSPHSYDINLFSIPENQQTEELRSEHPLREQSPIDCSYKTTMKAEAGLEKRCHHSPTFDVDEASIRANKSHDSGLLEKPVLKEDLEGCIDEGMIQHNNVLSINKYELSQEMGATLRDDSKNSYPSCNVELYREAEGMSKIVGSYLHPLPVLSVFLSNIENVIHICVLCGLLVEKNRTVITYTVEVKEPKVGYPSLVGHTTVLMPTLEDYLGKEIAVERTGFQLTPGGNYLVLIGGIRTPFCRTGSINCPCSTCTSGEFEENVVKIVQVKHGYVSTITSLRSTDILHCILVCEPDQLVAVGRGGRLHLWVMDPTWGCVPSELTIF
ncbi:hypothetical protein Csa_007889 [Cucumis sativus]|nr:hypothetical protein Csa_007889 [Cucumis sativus]